MKTRFRIAKNDTIKVTARCNGELLSSLYDSQFTSINEVISTLIRKMPHFSGKKIDFTIYNQSKDSVKYITKKVNRL